LVEKLVGHRGTVDQNTKLGTDQNENGGKMKRKNGRKY
jgi:hypothetical protein